MLPLLRSGLLASTFAFHLAVLSGPSFAAEAGTAPGAEAVAYRDVTNLIIQYRTERDAIEPYVPEALEITDPILTVAFVMNRGVEWMAGGVYNLAAVNVPVRFDGKVDHVEGGFALVLWENKVAPILAGREMTGIPKIGATIDDARHLFGRWMAEAAYEGNTFLEMSLEEREEWPAEAIAAWNRVSQQGDWLGWRYIPNVSGPGAALNHPVTFPQGSVIKSARTCTGTIKWKALTWLMVRCWAEPALSTRRFSTSARAQRFLVKSC